MSVSKLSVNCAWFLVIQDVQPQKTMQDTKISKEHHNWLNMNIQMFKKSIFKWNSVIS